MITGFLLWWKEEKNSSLWERLRGRKKGSILIDGVGKKIDLRFHFRREGTALPKGKKNSAPWIRRWGKRGEGERKGN